MARVRIVKLPKASTGAETFNPGIYGTNGNKQFSFNRYIQAGKISEQPIEARQTLEGVDREDANLEAELGETAIINVDGMPAKFNIGGKRHSQGGTPLNLPDNSFIFSDTAKMKIKDPVVLAQFGMAPKKGGYTPAEISKKYNINKFRKVLADPNSEDLDRKTAEMMIANYNEKLAKLSLAQESIKGFPQGIPVIAMPYIESMEIDPSTFLPDQAQGQMAEGAEPDADMGTMRFGGLPVARKGFNVPRDGKVHDVNALKSEYKTFKDAYETPPRIEPTWGDQVSKRPAKNAIDYSFGVKRGFKGDTEAERSFAENSETGPAYRKYVAALKSKDPKTMVAEAAAIRAKDIPGFAWWLGSDQNKLSDLATILEVDARNITESKKPKEITAEEYDIRSRKQASELFTKVAELKRIAKDAGDDVAEFKYDTELEKLHKLHPDYKAAHFWRQEHSKRGAYGTPSNRDYVPEVKPIYYNATEQGDIDKLYKQYMPAKTEPKPAEKKAEEKKVVAEAPASTEAATEFNWD